MRVKLVLQNRQIVAYVNYEGEDFKYKFGREQSISHIRATLPKLVMDELFDRKVKSSILSFA